MLETGHGRTLGCVQARLFGARARRWGSEDERIRFVACRDSIAPTVTWRRQQVGSVAQGLATSVRNLGAHPFSLASSAKLRTTTDEDGGLIDQIEVPRKSLRVSIETVRDCGRLNEVKRNLQRHRVRRRTQRHLGVDRSSKRGRRRSR